MIDKIQTFIQRYKELSEQMISPDVMLDMKKYAQIAKEHKSLENIVTKGEQYISFINQLEEYNEVLAGSDDELKEFDSIWISFFNVNTESELEEARQVLKQRSIERTSEIEKDQVKISVETF